MSTVLGKLMEKVFADRLLQRGKKALLGISTDTRTLKPGEVFLALKGEQFNGHGFLDIALQKGAAGLIISEGDSLKNLDIKNCWIWQVKDTTAAYQELAQAYLESKPELIKIGITGTSGKTTTKEFIRALLSVCYSVFANRGNYNNQIGVPLSALEVRNEAVAIFEMGAGEPGDISRLAQIVKPQIALVTSIGEGHLEFFGNTAGVALEKTNIAVYAEQALCPFDINEIQYFTEYKKVNPQHLFKEITLTSAGYELILDDKIIHLPFWGSYNLDNFALAVGVALDLGLTPAEIAEGMNKIKIPALRQEYHEKNGRHFWLDCYNANPLSMKKAIEGFAALPGEKILVLADMLELGDNKQELHREIGFFLNEFTFKKIYFTGVLMREAFPIYKGIKEYYENKIQLTAALLQQSQEGDVLLLKASRGMKLEEVYEMF